MGSALSPARRKVDAMPASARPARKSDAEAGATALAMAQPLSPLSELRAAGGRDLSRSTASKAGEPRPPARPSR
eukprot:3398936-Lingulodinium_polyedra.AAC.1